MSGFTGKFVRIELDDNENYRGVDVATQEEVDLNEASPATVNKAFSANNLIGEYLTTTGKIQWRQIDPDDPQVKGAKVIAKVQDPEVTEKVTHKQFVTFIQNSTALKPNMLHMDGLKWRYLVRSVMRGRNIMMTGPAGSGKTYAALALAQAFPNRSFFKFNLGATQDPRSALVGNTHAKDGETLFDESAFVRAIQTQNAIILLDELTRAHPEAWNILMPVLDQSQRYLRLEEAPDSPVIDVADGVSFIATANIGIEYTATRVLDRALQDRFIVIEMDVLDDKQEASLLQMMYPNINKEFIKALAEIAHTTRTEAASDSGRLSRSISTRANVEAVGLAHDGFSIVEIAKVVYYPLFDADGGLASERAYVEKLVQKFADIDKLTKKNLF